MASSLTSQDITAQLKKLVARSEDLKDASDRLIRSSEVLRKDAVLLKQSKPNRTTR